MPHPQVLQTLTRLGACVLTLTHVRGAPGAPPAGAADADDACCMCVNRYHTSMVPPYVAPPAGAADAAPVPAHVDRLLGAGRQGEGACWDTLWNLNCS